MCQTGDTIFLFPSAWKEESLQLKFYLSFPNAKKMLSSSIGLKAKATNEARKGPFSSLYTFSREREERERRRERRKERRREKEGERKRKSERGKAKERNGQVDWEGRRRSCFVLPLERREAGKERKRKGSAEGEREKERARKRERERKKERKSAKEREREKTIARFPLTHSCQRYAILYVSLFLLCTRINNVDSLSAKHQLGTN